MSATKKPAQPAKKKTTPAKKRARVVRSRNATRADAQHKLNLAALDAANLLARSMRCKWDSPNMPSKEQLQAAESILSRVVPKLRHTEVTGEIATKQSIVIEFD